MFLPTLLLLRFSSVPSAMLLGPCHSPCDVAGAICDVGCGWGPSFFYTFVPPCDVAGALCDDVVANSLDFVQCYNRSLLLFPMRSCLMLAFTLVIDAGVGVGVVCAFVFPIFDLTQHPIRTLQPATPKFCSQNSPSK